MKWIQPMEPLATKKLITGDEWLHQIKWDGIRGMTYIDGDSLDIYTKSGNKRTAFYPELNQLKRLFKSKNAVLDGEIVVLDSNGKPSFQLSLTRERVKSIGKVDYYQQRYPIIYIIFDILYIDDRLLTQLPLYERKELLLNTIEKVDNIIITDDFRDGQRLFELMKQKNWEGIVSKKIDSPYIPAKKHKAWYKLKTVKKTLAIVCGVSLKNGYVNSLILGIYREDSLVFIGKCSVGLTQKNRYTLTEYSSKLEKDICPFEQASDIKAKDIKWFEPVITCWVSFLEWTNDGSLRHPKILGFADLDPLEADGREWSIYD